MVDLRIPLQPVYSLWQFIFPVKNHNNPILPAFLEPPQDSAFT